MAVDSPTERDPVLPTERVLRRIHKMYYNAKERTVNAGAFSPRKDDADGISLFRELFATPKEVAAAGRKSGNHYVGRLDVGDLLGIEVTVKASPEPDGPRGHAVIPEMNITEWNNKKKNPKLKEIRKRMADMAARDIAFDPDAE